MKRAVILTGHFPNQKRRGSMLWVSEALQQMGWHVTLVTVGYSWLSHLRQDPRLHCLPEPPRPGIHKISAQMTSVYSRSPIHPFSTGSRLVDRLVRPLHKMFVVFWAPRLRLPLAEADLVLIESGPPVLLAPIARSHAPRAKMIYRVNDDIRLLKAPEFLVRSEREFSHHFDRISTASPHLKLRFKDHANVTLDPMGIPQAQLRNPPPTPFVSRARKEAICAGTTQLDIPALVRIAQTCPDWRIHVLGRLRVSPPNLPNLKFYGEQSFRHTLGYIAHADIGLAPYLDRPGVEYQSTNSNRLLLYRHFGLPTLGPDRLCHPTIPSIIGYSDPGWVELCETLPKRPDHIPDWSELANRLVQ